MRTALGALALSLLVSAPAQADRRPVDEGGDERPCIVAGEFRAIKLDAPRRRVERIVDSLGRRVNPDRAAVIDALAGQGGLDVDHSARREVRLWHLCDEPHHAFYFGLVEYSLVGPNRSRDRVTAVYLSAPVRG